VVQVNSVVLWRAICRDIDTIREMRPGCVIIWSHILPRLYWHGANNTRGIDKARKRINSKVERHVMQFGGKVIRHPDIVSEEIGLFRFDGTHLSDIGNDIFLNEIQGSRNIWHYKIINFSVGTPGTKHNRRARNPLDLRGYDVCRIDEYICGDMVIVLTSPLWH
jgi:hypothetical protein